MIRVVVVEDELFWQHAIQSTFSTQNDIHLVDCYQSVESVMENIIKGTFYLQNIDLVLLDVSLGGHMYGGLDLAYEFMSRKNDFPSMRWVMLTSHDQEELIAEFFAAGASNYLCKSNIDRVVPFVRDVYANRDALDRLPANALRNAFQKLREENDRKKLTGMEKTILSHIHSGNSILMISKMIHVAERTIKNHINRILRKLNVQSSKEAARLAVHRGWLQEANLSEEE